MTESDLVPAIFLYTKMRERIEGATRFQKLVFLAQKEGDLPELYDYEGGKYGPFSKDLASSIDDLRYRGIIERNIWENEVGQEKHVFSLTTDGIRAIQEYLAKTEDTHYFDAAQEAKQRFNDWDLERLLKYVYNKYPSYTTETELDLKNLFDPDSESQFLEPNVNSEAPEDLNDDKTRYRNYIVDATAERNQDGTWTARDTELNFTTLGDTKEEALDNLGEVIAAEQGEAGHEPTDAEIRALGVEPETARDGSNSEIPDYMD